MSAHMLRGAALAAAVALAGCGGDMDDLQAYAEGVKARKSTAIEPIPQIKPYEAFAYEAAERRDPFLKLEPKREQELAGTGIQPPVNHNKEPLEEFPIDALRMVGTLNIRNMSFALIKAPDNIVHRVAVGNYMGQNYGKITKVSEVEVALVEIIPDGFGSWQERQAVVTLSEE